MAEAARILQDITSQSFKKRGYTDRVRIFHDFAGSFGWHPSDYLGAEYGLEAKSNGHLLVEHGLEHAAVLTFIAEPARCVELSLYEARALLQVSYNNLVDLHLVIDSNAVTVYFNRAESPKVEERKIGLADFAALRAEEFQRAPDYGRMANIPALDTVMIATIDYWKRFLYGEVEGAKKNENLSALFNAIIFVRAVEDHYELKYGSKGLTLLERWQRAGSKDLPQVLTSALRAHKAGKGAASLLSLERLQVFSKLDPAVVESLFLDFYRVKRTPYSYNFALMSRHAVSRIYEKYVALLRQEEGTVGQDRTLFPIDLPEAQRNKAAGVIYTPQFIPRFFSRFIEAEMPSQAFRQLKIADPACGSGIFLRTFLEQKMEGHAMSTAGIKQCFKRVLGLDVDENACQASRLSLALLHLMRTDELPTAKSAEIRTAEVIEHFENNPDLEGAFGAVLGNPPFVRWELMTETLRERVRQSLSDVVSGRVDLYLGILRVAMRMVEADGYLAFVLPHSFLVGGAPNAIRNELREEFWIRSIVDLSAIRVFEDFSAYVVLLIAQKKSGFQSAPACRVVLCQDFVGKALQDCLDNKTVRTPYYSVFDVEQEYFGDGPWFLIGPEEARLEQKLKKMCTLDDFLLVREGMVTGDDSHYILGVRDLRGKEKELFAPFLPDRQIERYTVPKKPSEYVYYPYKQKSRIPEEELKKRTATWTYLEQIREHLRASASRAWPYLVRGREKDNILRPKIIAPHLMLVPRFALDLEGKYVVSRGPFVFPRENNDPAFLKFFAAVLNSSVVHWYLGSHAYRFSEGYVQLDPKYVRAIPVPDPSRLASALRTRIVELVDRRLESESLELERELDCLVLEAYGLDSGEKALVARRI